MKHLRQMFGIAMRDGTQATLLYQL